MIEADGWDELTDRLYALPPADFVPARDEAAKAARAGGDRGRATAIGKLRRPTVAAWLVNLLALRRSERLGELLELGAALRSAQHELRGSALRELAAQRRAAVAALVAEACDLAVEAGASRSGLPVVDVETTLVAALADEQLADVVRAGRLLKSGSYDGFGETPRPQLHVVEGGGDEPEAAPRGSATPVVTKAAAKAAPTKAAAKVLPTEAPPTDAPPTEATPSVAAAKAAATKAAAPIGTAATRAAERHEADAREARRRLDGVAAELADAEAGYDAAVRAVDEWSREVTDIEERLTQLRRERSAAHSALLAAQAAQDSADASREAVRRRFAAAERAARKVR